MDDSKKDADNTSIASCPEIKIKPTKYYIKLKDGSMISVVDFLKMTDNQSIDK